MSSATKTATYRITVEKRTGHYMNGDAKYTLVSETVLENVEREEAGELFYNLTTNNPHYRVTPFLLEDGSYTYLYRWTC